MFNRFHLQKLHICGAKNCNKIPSNRALKIQGNNTFLIEIGWSVSALQIKNHKYRRPYLKNLILKIISTCIPVPKTAKI